MKLNKVNYIRDPRTTPKRRPGGVLPKWKPFEYVPNLKENFDPLKPYFVVCGDAGGELPYLAVIDLDGISAEKIQKEIVRVEKSAKKGKVKKNKYDSLDPNIKKAIMQNAKLPDREEVLESFMEEYGLDDTYIVRTQSGWFHLYYFIDDNGTNLKNKVAKNFYKQCSIDLRPAGGMVYGEGTMWKGSDSPYTLYRGSEDKIANIPGWKVAWVSGITNYEVAGVNLGDFISGKINVHDVQAEKDKEFIVWREAMFMLKNLGYGKQSVEKIFTNQPAYDAEICGDQIVQWWDKESDPRRVTATSVTTGKGLERHAPGRGYWKFGEIPWYIHFEKEWFENYRKKVKYISDYNEWVAFNEEYGYYKNINQLLIDEKIDIWLDDNFVESSTQKKNLEVKRLKAKLFSTLLDYGNHDNLRCINNGVLNIKTKVLKPYDEKYLFLSKMEVNYKKTVSPTPYIDRIRKAYPIEFERLERFVQVVLHQDMSNELMCFVYGPTSSGKGTVGGLIKKMFKGVLSFAGVETLGKPFGKVPLLTKLMNYNAEMNIGFMSKESMAVMKHIVGLDGELSVNKKFTSQFMYDFDKFFFMSFTNQLPKLASTDIKAWFRRVWLIHFDKIQDPDPEMKAGILDEIDDWFTYLVNKEYIPIKTKGMDLNKFMEANKEQWYTSAIPLISICAELFKYTKNPDNELNSDDVATWCSNELYSRGYYAPDRHKLKKEITNILGAVGVYTKRVDNRTWYYNIKVKDIKTQVKQIMQEKIDYEQRGS